MWHISPTTVSPSTRRFWHLGKAQRLPECANRRLIVATLGPVGSDFAIGTISGLGNLRRSSRRGHRALPCQRRSRWLLLPASHGGSSQTQRQTVRRCVKKSRDTVHIHPPQRDHLVPPAVSFA